MPTNRNKQFRESSEEKTEPQQQSKKNDTSISETIHQELALEKLTSLKMFELAQKQAQQELAASKFPELTDEEMNKICSLNKNHRYYYPSIEQLKEFAKIKPEYEVE